MGLWGSKQQKELNIKNPEPNGQVFVTQNAIENVIKSNGDTKTSKQDASTSSSADLKLSADLSDKRIQEYERNMLVSLDKAAKEVENLFKERYQTVPVCLEFQKSVSQCYAVNKGQPLKCLDVSNEFLKCVEKERQNRFGLAPLSSS